MADSIVGQATGSVAPSIQSGGSSALDAMQAYHITEAASNARQQLEMQKQEQERNKATWFMNSVNALGKMPPGAQKIAAGTLADTAQRMMGGQQEFYDALKSDNDFRQNMIAAAGGALSRTLQNKGVPTEGDSKIFLSLPTSGLSDSTGIIEHLVQSDATARAAEMRNSGFEDRIKSQQQLAAQQQWNHAFDVNKPITQRLEGANRVLDLIDAAERGDIKSNKALLGQMNAEVARLETGSQSPGLGQSEKTELESSAADLKALMDKISNGVSSVDLRKQFQQVRGTVGNMYNSYYEMGERQANSLSSGALPTQQEIFNQKLNNFRNSFSKRYSGGAPSQSSQQPSNSGAPPAPPPAPNYEHMTDDEILKQWKALHGGNK